MNREDVEKAVRECNARLGRIEPDELVGFTNPDRGVYNVYDPLCPTQPIGKGLTAAAAVKALQSYQGCP